MIKSRKKEPVVVIRPATVADMSKLMAFYNDYGAETNLSSCVLQNGAEDSSVDTDCLYMISTVNEEIKVAFRMRFVADDRASGERVAILDRLVEKDYMVASEALDEAESFAKAQGCQTGILKGKYGKQLWPCYHPNGDDIAGDDYGTLLRACGEFCSYVSFSYPVEDGVMEKYKALEAYEIPVPPAIVAQNDGFSKLIDGIGEDNTPLSYRRYFRLCPELLKLMESLADSAYGWCSCCLDYATELTDWRPGDPIFYRADGSVFFYDCAHEGLCILTPRADEDVFQLLVRRKWFGGRPF